MYAFTHIVHSIDYINEDKKKTDNLDRYFKQLLREWSYYDLTVLMNAVDVQDGKNIKEKIKTILEDDVDKKQEWIVFWDSLQKNKDIYTIYSSF